MIKCIVLEDEKPAQRVLQKYIEKTPFLSSKGVYESGLHIPLSSLQNTDLLFLDIQLPELSGLAFLKTLKNPPKVIITTAYPNYAIEAFEEAVTDYLVKPFSYERFFKAVDRIRNQAALERNESKKNVFVYTDKTFFNIQIEDILFIKGEADYINIATNKREYLILDSLRNWNEKLKGFNFLQPHRSYIVNINKIKKVYGNLIYLSDELKIPIGKTLKAYVLDSLKE
ncbi:LytR/AlgR family response regulator transcription factor [Changchengzhania lutea]|uniref:LytR/AlgR family response regulator transcription factor n=1 Tax=Changchengzhania lutea TaxID=2049305 RepID=UPI00115CDBAA|nr:LytTR family DNA-binding domain-containing protein [Changchengzhania lutea]